MQILVKLKIKLKIMNYVTNIRFELSKQNFLNSKNSTRLMKSNTL